MLCNYGVHSPAWHTRQIYVLLCNERVHVCLCVWARETKKRRPSNVKSRGRRAKRGRRQSEWEINSHSVIKQSSVLNQGFCPSDARLWLLWYKMLAAYNYCSFPMTDSPCWILNIFDLCVKKWKVNTWSKCVAPVRKQSSLNRNRSQVSLQNICSQH